MRLLRLEIERYGRLADKTLDFRSDARLHVVYGRNEAGKTSSLDAITDLLYGFPHITRYDFLFDKTKLGIGATIVARDGTRLTFKRRKGTKNTLLDPQGKSLGEDMLVPYLASVSRPVFLSAFGLSKETLRAGAEEMLKSGGEAGASLIAAASGLKGLNELRRRLDQEASAIFAPTKAQHRKFYQARDRQEQAAKDIRQLALQERDLKARRAQIHSLEQELQSKREQRAETIRRREFLERQLEIGPLLLEIATNEDRLKNYEHLPPLPSGRIAELRLAYGQVETAAGEFERLRNELAGAKATAEGFVVEAPLIALRTPITLLVSESGSYSALKAQLPRVQSEADGFARKLDEYRLRLGLGEGIDLARLRPSDLVIAQMKERIRDGKRLETERTSLSSAIDKEQAAHRELIEREASQPASADPGPLRERLQRLMPALSQLPEAARLQRVIKKDSQQLRERAAQLEPTVTDLDRLAETHMPSSETIAQSIATADRLSRELANQQSSLAEVEKLLPGLRSGFAAFEQDRLDSTPERIAELRSIRASQWKPLRAVLLGQSHPLPTGEAADRIIHFEQSMEESDRLADDAVRNADRLANRAAASKRLEEEEERRQQVLAGIARKKADIAAFEADWQMLWVAQGLVPTAPHRMEGWLTQVRDLLDRRAALRDNSRILAELEETIAGVEPALRDLGRQVGITEADKLPADALLAGIQEALERQSEAWRRAHELRTLVKDSEKRLEELEQVRRQHLENAEREWSKAWAAVTASLHLPAEATLDQATVALEIWQQVPATLNELEDRTRRVQGMRRDMQDFEGRTSARLAQLGETEMGIAADAAIKAVAERLTKALQTESKALVANQRVAELKEQIVIAEAHLARAHQTFEALAIGLPESNRRAQQIGELEARESILKSLREQRQTLIRLSRGKAESELRAALEGFDDTSAAAEIEELNARQAQQNRDENELFARLRQEQAGLAELENGTGAEIALQVKKNAEAQLLEYTREWGVKRLAQMLLSHAIERFRSQQEEPLLKRAGELFAQLTHESFSGIEQQFDENDNVQLVGRRDGGHTVCIDGMSEGTRDQLYLALRLAYLEDYATTMEPLPFIGDDLLTNFDDQRTERGLAALAAVGERLQPILFTHHQRVVDLAECELGSAVDVIRLE